MSTNTNIKNIYNLSPMQEGMLFHSILNKESNAYFESLIIDICGELDIDIFEKSFNMLIERYDILRTVFVHHNLNKPKQIVFKERTSKICFEDISTLEEDKKKIYIENYVENDRKKGFDLSKDVLMRISIIKKDPSEYTIIWSNHHILMDGWCNTIIINEFFKIYESIKNSSELKLSKVYSYIDYIKWLNNQNKDEAKKYWENYLENYDSNATIPYMNKGTEQNEYIQNEYTLKIDKKLTKELEKTAKANQVTLNTIIQSVWGILLQKYNNTNDVVFGAVTSGRNPEIEGVETIVGLFINTVPIRIKNTIDAKFNDLIRNINSCSLTSNKYDYYPLADIQSLSKFKGQLINNIMVFENYPVEKEIQNEGLGKLDFAIKDVKGYEQTNYNLNLIVFPGEEIEIKFKFNELAYNKSSVHKIAEHFDNVIRSIADNKEILISDIEIIGKEEKERIIYEFNDTKAEYPREKTIQELFEEQVERTPDNIAVVFEEEKLTYKELNEKSNSLAKELREKGVKEDSIVGIMTERSLEMIIGIMGTLKAGGAYLPIDPSYPKERIEYMLKDSETSILLSQESLLEGIEFEGIVIDLYKEELYKNSTSNLVKINNSNNLAYVIYTSGTTGKAKGAMIEHKNVVRLMFNDKMPFDFTEKDVWTMFHSFCFDFSVWEMYGALLYGGKLIVIPKEIAQNSKMYLELLKNQKVTILNQVPSVFYTLIEEELKIKESELDIRYVIFGGEALKPIMLKEWKEKYPQTKLINMYGITETTVHVTIKEITDEEIKNNISNIGRPIPTLTVYIMDKNLKLAPIGVVGEICVGGEGVARSYLNREELSKEKFAKNPYKPEEKIYRSGDSARILANGEIEYVGRIDQQVKIRGYRIELGEIENSILHYQGIKEAVVIDREEEGNKYLCAYVVCEEEIVVRDIRKYLTIKLPEYMIPSYFVQIEKMPLTSNGKADRKALPKPEGKVNTGEKYEAPRNEVEETLAKIWSEVLGLEKVGINDNFFDLGGHSLKATVLVSKIHKELNREIPLKELFKTPTIKELSSYIERAEENVYSKIEKTEEKEYYEASSAQKRMYILQQFDKESTAYNMPMVLELEGKIDKNKIEEAFKELSKRHETLRTYFEIMDEEIVQKIQNNYEFKLEQREENIENVISSFIKPFELEKAPLLRAELVEDKEKIYLLVDMHHIISDGVSMSIITNEFAQLYNGKKPDELKLQYKDFAEWQNKFLKTEEMKKQEEYWINRFSDEIPVLNMPTDYNRPAMKSFEGDSINFEISEEMTSKLRKLTKETGTTMHMALLSALNILLSKYSGQEDIIIGTPIAGRPHADLQNIMGMFVNTLALRNNPERSKKYIDFLKEVKENSLKAYENQSYQLETLVEKLDIRKDTSRNPLFDVMFNMIDTAEGRDIKLEDIILKPYNTGSRISKFDMTLNAIESGAKLYFSIEYCTKLFKKETIERLGNHYTKLLDSIVSDVEIKLSEIELLSQEEKKQILEEFNDTKAEYPREKTIQELFEEQAERTPDNIAVVFEDKRINYKELNEKSNSLARVLRDKGVKADSIVGIMAERSLEMIIGIMGILKAGGAYLPIDPSYPKERIEYMLEDSKAKILLSEEALLESIKFEGIIIDLHKEELYKNDTSNLEKINTSNNLAYVIYTSGSTGKPKGVLVEHKSVIRLVKNTNYIEFKTNDKILQTGSMVFDASTFEVWGSLLNGLELHLAKNETIMIAQSLEELLIKNNISILWLTSELFNQIAEININIFRGLRCLLVGGDILSPKYINAVREKFTDLKIINGYGPTENTTFSTTYLIKDISFNVPIGRPISNTKAYIVNKSNRLSPIGIYGELCLSGDGLARGYLNRSELTKEKFVDNPFETGTKMYKTGDLARWMPDGNIEFLGRVDNQVKIRGFRIELGEIESRILQHEKVKEAVVLVKENKEKEKYICAYVVSENSLEELNLKNYLKEILPEYMIPSYFVQIEKMPITPNGKLDRRQLPKPDMELISTKYEAPRNEIEETLAKIWSEVLGIERVGINDNFFDLGGHSLKATIIASKIYNEFKVTVPLVELYNNPYISYVSEYIANVDLEEFQKNEYIVLLKKGINKDKNFFFIHSLSGEAEVYTNLVRNTYNSFNYWGIRYKKTDSIDSCVATIEELAKDYIIEIKKIQPTGPYYISGWCIGGVIALEIAKQLEKMNDEVKFVGLYNSPIINENLFHHRSLKRKLGISLKSEFNILEKILPGYNLREKYKGIKSVESLWNCVVEYLDKEKNYDEIKEKIYTQVCLIAPIMKKVIKEYKKLSIRDILHYFNLYRGILYVFYGLYKPKERINAEITYFVAGKEPKENKESWNNYTNKTTNFYIVDADHFSMFEVEEDIKKLSKVLENVLKNIS